MTNPVCYEAGGNEVTKLTRQFRNGLSESNSNLFQSGGINTTTVRGHKLWRRANLITTTTPVLCLNTQNSEQKWRETGSKREKRSSGIPISPTTSYTCTTGCLCVRVLSAEYRLIRMAERAVAVVHFIHVLYVRKYFRTKVRKYESTFESTSAIS